MRIFALLLLLPIGLFALNGGAEIGVGVKSKGMGGVGIALSQDSFASAFNPAALYCVGNRVDVGVGYTNIGGRSEARSRTSGGILPAISGDVTTPHLWFPEIGMALRCGCQSFGLAAYVKGGISTKYDNILYFTPHDELSSRFEMYTIFITPSWSLQVNRCLSLGIALNGIIQTLRNNINDGNPSFFPNRGVQFLGTGRLGRSGGVNVRVGALLAPSDCLRIGLTYQSRPLMSHIKEYKGQWPDRAHWEWPQELGIGAAYTFCQTLLFSIDWNYYFWSRPLTYGNSDFHVLSREGGSGGGGFGWVDQTVWKVGVAWTPRCWLTFRAGYNFGNSPVVAQAMYINPLTLSCVQNHATCGLSVRGCLGEFSLYYYHGFHKAVRGQGPAFVGSSAYGVNIAAVQDGFGLSYGYCW